MLIPSPAGCLHDPLVGWLICKVALVGAGGMTCGGLPPVKEFVVPQKSHETVLTYGAGSWLHVLVDGDRIHRLARDCGSYSPCSEEVFPSLSME